MSDFPTVELVCVHGSKGHQLKIPTCMPTPVPQQFKSTVLDNLIELSGRVCYDSVGSEKSRSSEAYHKHIDEVQHYSVREHAVFTFQTSPVPTQIGLFLMAGLANRPGVFTRLEDQGDHSACLRITCNVRCLCEWSKWPNWVASAAIYRDIKLIGQVLTEKVRHLAPLALAVVPVQTSFAEMMSPDDFAHVDPNVDEERWLSFYLDGISRGLTHELVRHRHSVAYSQRSTRYVDESESPWIPHPLMLGSPGVMQMFDETRTYACERYDATVKILEAEQLAKGVDALTARKQARGAARGLLGNALETAMIFSSSLSELKWIFHLRAANPADAEIRIMAVKLFKICRDVWPDCFPGWALGKSSDGLSEIAIHP